MDFADFPPKKVGLGFFKGKLSRCMIVKKGASANGLSLQVKDAKETKLLEEVVAVNMALANPDAAPQVYAKASKKAATADEIEKARTQMNLSKPLEPFDGLIFNVLVEVTLDIGSKILFAFNKVTADEVVEAFKEFREQEKPEKPQDVPKTTAEIKPNNIPAPEKELTKRVSAEIPATKTETEKQEPVQEGNEKNNKTGKAASHPCKFHCISFNLQLPTRETIVDIVNKDGKTALNFLGESEVFVSKATSSLDSLPNQKVKLIHKCEKDGEREAEKIMKKNKLSSLEEICLKETDPYTPVCGAIFSEIVVFSGLRGPIAYGFKTTDVKRLYQLVNNPKPKKDDSVKYPIQARALEDRVRCVLIEETGYVEGSIGLVEALPTHLHLRFEPIEAKPPLLFDAEEVQECITGKQATTYDAYKEKTKTTMYPVQLISPDGVKTSLVFFDTSWIKLVQEHKFLRLEEQSDENQLQEETQYSSIGHVNEKSTATDNQADALPLPEEESPPVPQQEIIQAPIEKPNSDITKQRDKSISLSRTSATETFKPYQNEYSLENNAIESKAPSREIIEKFKQIDPILLSANVCLIRANHQESRAYFKFVFAHNHILFLVKPFSHKFYQAVTFSEVKTAHLPTSCMALLNVAKTKAVAEIREKCCPQIDATHLTGLFDNLIFQNHFVIIGANERKISILVEHFLAERLMRSFE